MHAPDLPPAIPPSPVDPSGLPWWRELNRHHWFVLAVCALGWLFDTMDQQLFTLARRPAMVTLLTNAQGEPPSNELVADYAGYTTSIFLIGWGAGGLIFGILGDLVGRAKSMMLTILLYSIFTGLSAMSHGVWDFSLYRFLTGLGVGGEFAVGVSLVAEVMPDRARPFALGLLQALSAVGNIMAAVSGIVLAYLSRAEIVTESWRYMFVIGAAPAFLAVFAFARLQEPEKWRALAQQASMGERFRSYYAELFHNPRWTKNALIGLLLASSGIIGLWGIGFFAVDLQRLVFRTELTKQGAPDVAFQVDLYAGWTSVMLNVGAFFGIYAFSRITAHIGRRPAFAVSFLLAMLSTAFVFWKFQSIGDIFWMIPIMGFCQLALFGGYAIYFPELFPTRLRSSGTSFCYNIARFVAAAGPTVLGRLTSQVFADHPQPWPMRYAGITMCAVFLVGLAVLPFAPETRGQPLPE